MKGSYFYIFCYINCSNSLSCYLLGFLLCKAPMNSDVKTFLKYIRWPFMYLPLRNACSNRFSLIRFALVCLGLVPVDSVELLLYPGHHSLFGWVACKHFLLPYRLPLHSTHYCLCHVLFPCWLVWHNPSNLVLALTDGLYVAQPLWSLLNFSASWELGSWT